MAEENTVEAQMERFKASISNAEDRKAVEQAFESADKPMPTDIRDRFDKFVQDERDQFYEEQKAEQKLLDPKFAIPLLANQIKKLEEKLRVMELDDLIEEDPETEQVEENTQNIESVMKTLKNFRGTGYNVSPRLESDGSIEMFGRYNGPFYAEPLTKDQQLAGSSGQGELPNPYSDTLRVYNGVVNAGNSKFYWPTDWGDPYDAIDYRDFKFDHTTLGTSPTSAVGIYVVYLEIAVYPAAVDCSVLWDDVLAHRYSPILRAYKYRRTPVFTDPYPDQEYSIADHTQADDLAYCETTGAGNPYTRINPRGLDLNPDGSKQEDILVAKFILGTLTIGTDESNTRAEITKWAPRWHASDIYCPVWQWAHCTTSDGIDDYPDADSLDCIFGASLCSPTCFTAWNVYNNHTHVTGGATSGIPAEPNCTPV